MFYMYVRNNASYLARVSLLCIFLAAAAVALTFDCVLNKNICNFI